MKKNKWLYSILLGLSSIGFHMNAQSATDCTNPDKKDSRDSTCVTGVGLTSIDPPPPASSFKSKSTKPFKGSGTACTTPWGTTVAHNSSVAAYNQLYGSYDYTTGEFGADCLEEERNCNNGVLSGTYEYESCGLVPTLGTCGPANGAYYIYPTSGPAFADQCNPSYVYGGAATTDSPPSVPASSGVFLSSNTYTWTCAGENGGSSSTCNAFLRVNAQCGTTTNTCVAGNPGGFNAVPINSPYDCDCVAAWYRPSTGAWLPYDPLYLDNWAYPSFGYVLSTQCNTCYTTISTNSWICYGINGGSNVNCVN